jgi:tetratricopeptide (TPR) repeat protein
MQGGKSAEAAKAFAAASAVDPGSADYRHDWALALLDSGDPKSAREVAEAIPGRENSAETQSLLADIAERLGDYKAAGEYYKAAASLDPSEANINALAFEFLKHWTFDPAIKMYQIGLSEYPESVRLRLGLGIAQYASNNYPASALIFSGLLDKDPDNALYADLLGHSCSLIADEQGTGCDSLEAFAEHHPKNAEAAAFAAASILRRPVDEDQLGKAKRLLDSALSADPKLAEAHYEMGLLYQQQKQWAASVPPLEQAVALRPKFSEAHYHLARSYFQLGRKQDGQREISLQQKYSQQAKDDVNERFKKLTTFLVTVQ